MIDNIAVGNKIASLRKQNAMNQDELASRLFVTRQLISKWELGIALPSTNIIVKLSQIFKIPIEELLCLEEYVDVDPKNIFVGHNRDFIIKGIIEKTIKVNIEEVFVKFNASERLLILKAIKEEKISCYKEKLMEQLTPGEKSYLNLKLYTKEEK